SAAAAAAGDCAQLKRFVASQRLLTQPAWRECFLEGPERLSRCWSQIDNDGSFYEGARPLQEPGQYRCAGDSPHAAQELPDGEYVGVAEYFGHAEPRKGPQEQAVGWRWLLLVADRPRQLCYRDIGEHCRVGCV